MSDLEQPFCPRCFEGMYEAIIEEHSVWLCQCSTVKIPEGIIHVDEYIKRHLRKKELPMEQLRKIVGYVEPRKEKDRVGNSVKREVGEMVNLPKNKVTTFGRSER